MQKNNVILLDNNVNNNSIIDFTNSQNICFFDYSKHSEISYKFNIYDCDVNINWLSIEKNNNKKINIEINILGKNSHINFISNSLLYDQSNISFRVIAKNKNGENNYIDIKIFSLINDNNSKFNACPIFDFSTNAIDAKHSVNIGGLNKEELSYIMSRGIDTEKAKMLLINSKIQNVLKFLNEKQKQVVNSKINELVGIKYEN